MLSRKAARCKSRLALALVIGLALLGFLSVPVQAQGPVIDLELGGDGATTWNIDEVKPGDSGTKTVELHNAGSRNGFVTIWISDIEQMDYNGDGAVLDDYLLLSLSCDRLVSRIDLPTTVNHFPKAASDMSLVVTPLNAGETVTSVWEWEFPETGEPQNDAQGDSFSFTIDYLLQELPSGGGSGGWGGAVPPAPEFSELVVDMWDTVASVSMTEEGILVETMEATSADRVLTLLLFRGTRVLDCLGNLLYRIEIEPVTLSDHLPDTCVIGLIYDVKPCCKFDPPIAVIIHYDPQALSDGVDLQDLVIAYYDENSGEWVVLPSVVDTGAHTVTALVSHSAMFAILGVAPEEALSPTPPSTPSSGLSTAAWIGIGIGILLCCQSAKWDTF